ncbi:MAG: hypothetical protein ACI3VZ_02240 [Faecousia sp.]
MCDPLCGGSDFFRKAVNIENKKGHAAILVCGRPSPDKQIETAKYTDCRGKRQCVYAPALQELRQKEKVIQKQIDDGIDYEAGQIIKVFQAYEGI